MRRYSTLWAFIAIIGACCPFEAGAKPPPGNTPSSPSGSGQNAGSASAGPPSTTPTATPQTAASTAPFEAQMLAYRALDSIAASVAANVCSNVKAIQSGVTPPEGKKAPELPVSIVIYDQASFANLLSYAAFVQNARSIVSSYGTFLEDSAKKKLATKVDATTGGPTVSKSSTLSLGFNPVSDVTGLLSALAVSSNSETYGSIVIPDAAVAVAVTRELVKLQSAGNWPGCKNLELAYPPLFGAGSATQQAAQDIQDTIGLVQTARSDAHEAVGKLIAVDKKQTTSTYPGVALVSALTDIDTLYDNFMNSLLQANTTTGVMGSAAVIQGHELATLIAGTTFADATPKIPERAPAYVLLATVLAAGGTTHDHKTFWTALSTGDKITYSGGTVVGVALWQSASNSSSPTSLLPVYSDILRYRIPFMRQPAVNAEDKENNLVTPSPPSTPPAPAAASKGAH
jgi:hypothetical protein